MIIIFFIFFYILFFNFFLFEMYIFNFFFQDSPKVTTFITLSCLSISILTWFEIISPLYLYLNFELIFKKYQFWRLFTCFFYYGEISLSLIFHMILFFRNSKFLESSVFKGNSADYIYFLLFCITNILIISFFVGFIFPASCLSFAMTYYWGRKSKNVVVQFMGIFNFRAPYLPWFDLLFSFLLDSEYKHDLVGMIVSHFFFFFRDIFPRIQLFHCYQILKTPLFLKKFCDKFKLNNDYIIGNDEEGIIF